MSFTLKQLSANQQLTKFHILDSAGDVIGSANVANADVAAFRRCWSGSATPGDSPSPRQSPTKALANAFLRSKSKQPVSQQAILRGC
jgi:hypothetical protein